MKKKKENLYIGIAVVLLLLLVVFFNSQTYSIVSPRNGIDYPVQERIVNWNGYNVNLTADYFGAVSTGDNSLENYDGEIAPVGVRVCGSDDAVHGNSINNSYGLVGNTLKISTQAVTTDRSCNNYVMAIFTLPKGTLTADCSIDSASPDYGQEAKCKINDYELNGFVTDYQTSVVKQGTKEFVLTEETTFSVLLESKVNANHGASSTSTIQLSFMPDTNQNTCTELEEKCLDMHSYICENGQFADKGLVNGKCGYSSGSGEDNGGNDTPNETNSLVYIIGIIILGLAFIIALIFYLRRR